MVKISINKKPLRFGRGDVLIININYGWKSSDFPVFTEFAKVDDNPSK